MEAMEIGMIFCGVISCVASLSVILTFYQFPVMRTKRFMKFIFYISLSDLILNISTAFGFPQNNSLCYAQGILCTIFSMCSWLWTTALSHTLYCVVENKKTIADPYLHMICWGLPLACALIPISLN